MEDVYSPTEEIINSLTHGIGAALSIGGTVLLVAMAVQLGDPWKIVSFSIFGFSLALLYLSSTLYHASVIRACGRSSRCWIIAPSSS